MRTKCPCRKLLLINLSGLYIHIPFCHSKCVYCDFYSTPRRGGMDEFVDGLIKEFIFRRTEIPTPFSTVYLGGGTPSILSEQNLEKIFNLILPYCSAQEITIEANPEDITKDKVDFWREIGINRLSIGVQSLDDNILRRLGRRHSSKKALEAINIIRSAGISNISADLIYALPGLTSESWRTALRTIFSTGIKHLSAYCLTYHEGTSLHRMLKNGKIIATPDEEIECQFEILRNESLDAGFEHYEISNLSLPGFRSRHNSSYWSADSVWLGLGPSAHSFDGRIRRIDYSDTGRWLNSLPSPFEIEDESELDLINDIIVTSLRTFEGLDLNVIPEEYRDSILKDAASFISEGHMRLHDNRLSIPSSRWLMSDFYIRELIR